MSDTFEPVGEQPEVIAVRVVALFVRDMKGRILCQLRDDLPHVAGAGLWSFFGGRVEAGESLRAAAVREFHEETGMRIAEADLSPRSMIASSVSPDWMIHIFELGQRVEPGDVCLGEGRVLPF
ncbi:NUDIX domain-containing protein [Lentibacter sp. XHP0401]|uniref:NUDIX domain-containing protein n=1 Tax=Lentibacter sp. XHP0401 TaxID=2984334 RepID=UPI0021E7B10D|nr:NUDIX domain-containing protein [Lentibacter sp. XHP0401]MCV2892918.1 NUDIX domain-containing protein [Lentibacter sp. XHP0401]